MRKMGNLKKVLAIGLAAVMTVGFAACSGGGTAEDIMKTAQEKLADIKSMSYDMDMTMTMTMQGQSMESSTKGTAVYNSDPMAMKMDMTVEAAGQSVAMQMYAAQEGDNYVMYMTQDGGATWMKQTLSDAAQLEQYNAQASMDLYLKRIDSFKEAGTEKINGSDAVKYEGVIANDSMNEVMAASGAAEMLTQIGISESDAAAMYQDLGDLPVSIWIDKESSIPVKYEMDMTTMMQTLMGKVLESMGASADEAGLTVDKVFMTMTLSDFNNVENIEIPEAAKNAQEAALLQ